MLILVVKQDTHLVAELTSYLEAQRHQVDVAYSSEAAFQLAQEENFDAIILGRHLRGSDGFKLCQKLRDSGNDTPVLMISRDNTPEMTLLAFKCGADDILPLPFSKSELLARITCRIRRSQHLTCQTTLRIADLEIDPKERVVSRDGKEILLTPTCLKILEVLARESPNVVPRSQLEHLVWGDKAYESNTLKAHIRNLRLAIDKPFTRKLIHTVRGKGYRLFFDEALAPMPPKTH